MNVEPATSGPTGRGPRRFPPSGLALWGTARPPSGTRFQIRVALVRGEAVCSVWRVNETADFTADDQRTMREVGKSLRWVR